MNKAFTSREEILSAGKEFLARSGAQALSIRGIAHSCGIAVGSIYNYFPSKEDLMIAVVESIWTEIMHDQTCTHAEVDFPQSIGLLFENIKAGAKKYPAFLNVHSMNFAHMDKTKGKAVMQRYFEHMKSGLAQALARDTRVGAGVFNDAFTRAAFVEFIFANILNLLSHEETSCDYLLKLIRRILYEPVPTPT